MNNFNQGKKMKSVMSAIALASIMSMSITASASDIIEDGSDLMSSRPSVWAMGLDAGLVRPVGLAATIVGAGIFVVTLPFSLLGDNVKESADTLITVPGKMTFLRCLGCTEGQDNDNKSLKRSLEYSSQ